MWGNWDHPAGEIGTIWGNCEGHIGLFGKSFRCFLVKKKHDFLG